MFSPDGRRKVIVSLYHATVATLFLGFLAWLAKLAGCTQGR